jgi:hypothetical protein
LLDLLTGLVVLFAGPVLVIWWLPYLVHELGHLMGARLAGAQFDYIPLGPFMLTPRGPRRLRRQIRRFACDSTVPTPSHSRWQLLMATVGGPALNIAVGVTLLVIGFLGDLGRSAFLAPLVLILVGLFMTMHGIIWLLPWRPYGVPSDGLRLWSLLAGTRGGRRWMALKEATAWSEADIRPRNWPVEVMSRLVVQSDGSIDDIAAAVMLYWHLLDSHRLTEARACLEQARAAASQRYMAQLNGQIVQLELAYIEARLGPDPAVAVRNLMQSAFIAKATLLRVFAAISLAYADLDGAEQAATAATGELPALRPGYARMESDLIVELVEEAQRRRRGGPGPAAAPPSISVGVDVSRFAVPDVALQEPAPPSGVRSSRAVVGFVGSAILGLAGYASVAAFTHGFAPLLAVVPAIASAFAVLRVRSSRGVHRVDGLRTAFAAMAVLFATSPLLVADVLRPNLSGYIWIVGQARPCTAFGAGHDITTLWVYLFAAAIAMAGLLMGTRAKNEPAVPRPGIYLGIGLVVLWIVAVASDHAHFAAVIGCGA